ncbi:MAG TPA: thiopurine S-methyltransferase [Steroidobacteraceae bacterium]|nr:thiopurine S-methyltransferase [Steroidobacteraceae bacterium]
MQPEFWHDRWRTGQLGFHKPGVDPNLTAYWPEFKLAAASPVLVPLCGKSLDLKWLRDRGHSVVGVELSAVALESFCMENGIPARRRSLRDFDVYEAEGFKLLRGDFFALTQQLLGPVAAVYDRAALISWTKDLRERYVAQLNALTSPGAKTLLITVEYQQEQMSGPPFSVGADEVARLYAADHEITQLGRHDVLASEARLRSRGLTELHEVCYQLTRL